MADRQRATPPDLFGQTVTLGAQRFGGGGAQPPPAAPGFGAPQGLDALKKIVANLRVPVYAIGGIKPENIIDVHRLGVRGVALISAIIGADRPKEAATTMAQVLRR